MLTVLHRDDRYVVIDKPPAMAVHPSGHAGDAGPYALHAVRDQVGRHVWPVHRLDRGTSGVLVFALDPEANARLAAAFAAREVDKRYRAIVRGWVMESITVDRALAGRDAVTHVEPLARAELDTPVGRYPTARYSLIEARPETGRLHQIRRHLAGIDHPVVGDVNHGDRHHNHFFQDALGVHRLLLMARTLTFTQPFSGQRITVSAPADSGWCVACAALGFDAEA